MNCFFIIINTFYKCSIYSIRFIIIIYFFNVVRIAAQTGSASALGVGGCWFESNLSEL